jgi:ParB family chromosome partitioning protein
LADAGTIKADTAVPCHLIDAAANATEISLVENAVRAQMHPADEFEAFLALIEGGMRAADIAARFGVTETVVQQRLKLARVSPVIIEAYRRGEIALAHVMAFAVSDDHAAQEHVWEELGDWQLEDPDNIRDALTESEVTAKDRRVKFVTLKAYEKAGGAVRRDLFARDEDGVFIQDIVLLESLVAKKLEKTAAAVRKEGWKWVEIRGAFGYSEWSKYTKRYPEPVPLPPAEQAELASLEAEQTTLSESVQDWEEIDPVTEARLAETEARLDELNDRESAFTPEDITIAGCVVSIGYDGKHEVHRGYILPEDAPKKTAKSVTQTDEDGNVITVTVDDKSLLPAALTESLTAQKSAALAACLTENPDIALAAVVHAMTLDVF